MRQDLPTFGQDVTFYGEVVRVVGALFDDGPLFNQSGDTRYRRSPSEDLAGSTWPGWCIGDDWEPAMADFEVEPMLVTDRAFVRFRRIPRGPTSGIFVGHTSRYEGTIGVDGGGNNALQQPKRRVVLAEVATESKGGRCDLRLVHPHDMKADR